jgi:hypothetical protein
MGATLPAAPLGATAPSFVVSALRDPGTVARPGTQLQRVQIVKGWRENGESHYQVYEVAGDPTRHGRHRHVRGDRHGFDCFGISNLFDLPRKLLYARIVENPTCRWNALECARLAPEDRPALCTNPAWPKAVQERAWTSPIWYTPAS